MGVDFHALTRDYADRFAGNLCQRELGIHRYLRTDRDLNSLIAGFEVPGRNDHIIKAGLQCSHSVAALLVGSGSRFAAGVNRLRGHLGARHDGAVRVGYLTDDLAGCALGKRRAGHHGNSKHD